jgi:hypothetical protein
VCGANDTARPGKKEEKKEKKIPCSCFERTKLLLLRGTAQFLVGFLGGSIPLGASTSIKDYFLVCNNS